MNTLHQHKNVIQKAKKPTLKLCYIITCYLSIFMVIWILIFPSSYHSSHNESLHTYIKKLHERPNYELSPRILTKYKGHAAVHYTHILPGALWSAAIPFQLHSTFKLRYRIWHRRIGYVFFLSSFLIIIGYMLIITRGLLYTNDYPDLPSLYPENSIQHPKYTFSFKGCWYFYTAVRAFQYAVQKKYTLHENYILRHVGIGLSVSLQRNMLGLCDLSTPFLARRAFGIAMYYAVATCVIIAEVVVFFVRLKEDDLHIKRV